MASAYTSERAAPGGPAPAVVRMSGVALARAGAASPILEHVELELAAGECVLLQGATGSGKSTLLRALAGLPGVECRAGRLEHAGRVTLLAQHVETQLLCTTVGEEVALGLRARNLPAERVRRLVRGALGRVGLAGMERREVDRLSAGEKQRVVLAALVALEPELLLLDEPSSALDPEARGALARVLGELKAQGTALLVADHAPAELLTAPDRRIALAGGRLCAGPGPSGGGDPSSGLLRRGAEPRRGWTLVTGPNGCGKSTRLRELAGREGRAPGDVALVIQEPRRSLFARSVGEEVAFGLLRRGVPERERRARVRELLARFDLLGCADRSPRRLSFGQQHRVAIAAALAPCPALVLLDEPFAGLDPAGRAALLALLADEQAESGAEFVLASHDREPLASWCARVIDLPAGEVPRG